jgi:DNA primase
VGRAILLGLARFPALLGRHGDAIADLPLREPGPGRLRDLMLQAAMEEAALDPERLHTILAAKGATALLEQLSLKRGLAFSFTRRDSDPERACRDLVLAIETLAARPGIEAAIEAATTRLGKAWEDEAFEEQKRLLAAREEADRQLATLFEADGD